MDSRDAPAAPARRPTTTDGAGITSGSLARRLGISPTTLRSWDRRYDLGPARRDQGRHRRWSPRDVAMIEEMCRLTASGVPPAEAARVVRERAGHPEGSAADTRAEPPAPAAERADDAPSDADTPPVPPGVVRAECRGLIRAALRLDSAAVQERLNAFVRAHGVITAWEELMMPTLHAVGRKWESSGDRYVEVEHLLSWHVSTALRNTPFLLGLPGPARDDNPVLLACVPGEQHTLPLEAVHAALLQAGRPARMLGAAVPADALVSTVRRTGPAAVMLWSQARSLASTPLAQHLLQSTWGPQGARQQPRLHLAGPGWRGATVERAVQPAGLREAVVLLAADPR
ncbi:MerR family transcriptional regulator [Streptomyces sp. NPDC088785]|uniref:MerR family transcriptional regulator n=1 Tax=Streptomyces sp. NPDC088785 TaxID=3365897 RepID=UPI0037F5FD59